MILSSTPTSKSKIITDKIAEAFANGVRRNQNKSHEILLNLPSNLLCSNSNYCNVVQISYCLEITGEASGCHDNIELKTPITIGNSSLNFGQEIPVVAIKPAFHDFPNRIDFVEVPELDLREY